MNMLSNRFFCITLAGIALFGYSTDSPAWGAKVHNTIGTLAINQLHADARDKLEDIVGPLDEQLINEACNWPDAVRETEEWEWSQPQHYINIPRGDLPTWNPGIARIKFAQPRPSRNMLPNWPTRTQARKIASRRLPGFATWSATCINHYMPASQMIVAATTSRLLLEMRR